MLLLLGGQGRPDAVELGQSAPEVLGIDPFRVEGLPFGGEFHQLALRGFDLLLNADNPVEPRAGIAERSPCRYMTTSQLSERESVARTQLANLLNEHEVARITGLSVASIRRWRLFKQGHRFLKIGASVRYRAEDLRLWLETRPTGGGL